LWSPESILAAIEEAPQAESVLSHFAQIAANGAARAR